MKTRSVTARAARVRDADGRHDLQRRGASRGFIVFCCAAVLVSALLKLPSLRYPQGEGDERIYWQLAENLTEGGTYTLQGSALLKELSPYMYDRPLFHHPPLFPALLVPFVLTGSKSAAVLVSWLGHAFTIIAVALVGRHILGRLSNNAHISLPAFWLPVLGVSADPLSCLCRGASGSTACLAALRHSQSQLSSLRAANDRRTILAIGGALLGLAALAKLTALIVAPVVLMAGVCGDETMEAAGDIGGGDPRGRNPDRAPWMILFYLEYGVLTPSWVKPDARLMELFPFVRVAVERPWYYYGAKLVQIMPLVLVPGGSCCANGTCGCSRRFVLQRVFGIVVTTLTVMGVAGYGFQMRHITPAIAAVYVVVLAALLERERPVLLMVCGFSMLVGTVTGAMHLLAPEFDEIVSLLRAAGVVSF